LVATAQVQQVLDLLVSCSRAEEECRNVVAECLGRLALLHPAEVLARLRTGETALLCCCWFFHVQHAVATVRRTAKGAGIVAFPRVLQASTIEAVVADRRHALLQSGCCCTICVGTLIHSHMPRVLPAAAGLSSESEHTRCVVVGAVKYMVVDKPHPVDDLLKVRGA
jgi:hypothetical protein